MLQDLFGGVLEDLLGGAKGILMVVGLGSLLAVGSSYLFFNAHAVTVSAVAHASK